MKEIKGFFGEYRWLSNFSPVTIEFVGNYYPSVEHAYVASKTTDVVKQAQVSTLRTPGEAKRFGKTLVLRSDWDEVRVPFMRDFINQKFDHKNYATLLLATDDAYIEETNTWKDTFWGVYNGVGFNTLGILIMEKRYALRKANT